MNAMRIDGLIKDFKNIRAVDGLYLSVPVGSIYGFLGQNGAGKTTTIRILAGFLRPTAGTCEIHGEPVQFGHTTFRRRIGFLPDVPAFYPYMTAETFLRMCADIGGTGPETISTLLDFTGLAGNAGMKISAYSRGMRQRLGLAQALINDPDILILDEPVSALDPVGRKEILDILSRFRGKKTVFFSTHILSDVERICDHVSILHKGKLLMDGPVDQIKALGGHGRILLEASGDLAPIRDIIEKQSWCNRADLEDSILSIRVNDRDAAGRDIPGIVAAAGVSLVSYRYAETTLEDIFIRAVQS